MEDGESPSVRREFQDSSLVEKGKGKKSLRHQSFHVKNTRHRFNRKTQSINGDPPRRVPPWSIYFIFIYEH